MTNPKTLQAFSPEEARIAQRLLATRVAFMMGRKFEEDDWAQVYCTAKGLEKRAWSNLDIDVMSGSLGVEQKMMCYSSKGDMSEACGTTMMHPSATRSIRVPGPETDAEEAMRDVLTQYGALIAARSSKVKELSGSDQEPDMRIGWLLWQDTLRQFLYFEQEMLIPKPEEYTAQWVKRISKGSRKGSTNLWIFEKGGSGRKRYSVTSEAGAKIQPYFDIPPITDKNVYLFTVIGEVLDTGLVRVWITEATHRELQRLLGDVNGAALSKAIMESAAEAQAAGIEAETKMDVAVPLEVTLVAYQALQNAFQGVSDDHSFQLLAHHLRKAREAKQ